MRRVATLLFTGVLAGCAPLVAPPAESGLVPPPQLSVEMFGGFPTARAPLPPDRVALIVDSTGSMRRGTGRGPSRMRAARAAAGRFAETLPADAELELFLLGNDPRASCDGLPDRYAGDRDDLLERVGRLRARGSGSLAATLDRFEAPAEGAFDRIVAFTALADECGGDLCQAVQGLAARGVRLDLVLIGDAEAPACVADVTGSPDDVEPVPWQRGTPVAYHVESVGPDPAVIVCGETTGLPVQVPAGNAAVVVKLDPPLRVERNFLPGTRWVLQVLDFPGLDPPERQWRWQAGTPPIAAAPPETP